MFANIAKKQKAINDNFEFKQSMRNQRLRNKPEEQCSVFFDVPKLQRSSIMFDSLYKVPDSEAEASMHRRLVEADKS